MRLGLWEIGLIVLVIVLLFGSKKIPELMKGLGSGMKEFKNAASDLKNDINDNDDNNKLKEGKE